MQTNHPLTEMVEAIPGCVIVTAGQLREAGDRGLSAIILDPQNEARLFVAVQLYGKISRRGLLVQPMRKGQVLTGLQGEIGFESGLYPPSALGIGRCPCRGAADFHWTSSHLTVTFPLTVAGVPDALRKAAAALRCRSPFLCEPPE